MLSAAKGQRIAKLTISVLQKIRSDKLFAVFYQRVIQDQIRFGVADQCLPRQRRAPQHFEVGSSTSNVYVTPEAHYRQIYYGVIDYVVEATHDRFDQPIYSTYWNLEELVVKAYKAETYNAELDYVCDFYKGDLSRAQLEAQLPLLQPLCDTEGINEITIHDDFASLVACPQRREWHYDMYGPP